MSTCSAISEELPNLEESAAYIQQLRKPRAVDVLRRAKADGQVLLQPRSGVGSQAGMMDLLRHLNDDGTAAFLTLTIDSYTRLKQFGTAKRLLRDSPSHLNGYPLIAHGWEVGRETNEAFEKPLQVRHGSPDARVLFDYSLASGFTSFEGGGIGYNLPYCKSVPLMTSLRDWQEIDAKCGQLETLGISIDREFFGSLSGVLVPPSISLAMIFLEAVLAAREGCRCLSLAVPQNGAIVQDVAALKVIRRLARLYLPDEVDVFPVLHQFMGVFPKDPIASSQMIFLGGLTARMGGATKTITKTIQESIGIPDKLSNQAGLRTTLFAQAPQYAPLSVFGDELEEEMFWLERETRELIDPILQKPDLIPAIVQAFKQGRLDIPFPASTQARGAIMPMRDDSIAVRYARFGQLPFSDAVKVRNNSKLPDQGGRKSVSYRQILDSILYFSDNDIDNINSKFKNRKFQ